MTNPTSSTPTSSTPAATLSLTARTFRDLVRPVLPHVATRGEPLALNAVHLYTHGGYVIAEATDRYTLGLCRAETTAPDGFDALMDLSAVRRILNLFKPTRKVNPALTITVDGDTIAVTGDAMPEMAGATLRFHRALGEFPTLRPLVAPAIDSPVAGTANPGTALADTREAAPADAQGCDALGPAGRGFNTRYLARFTAATRNGEPMVCRSTDTGVLIVTVGTHFLGAAMSVRLADDARDAAATWSSVVPDRPTNQTDRRLGTPATARLRTTGTAGVAA